MLTLYKFNTLLETRCHPTDGRTDGRTDGPTDMVTYKAKNLYQANI